MARRRGPYNFPKPTSRQCKRALVAARRILFANEIELWEMLTRLHAFHPDEVERLRDVVLDFLDEKGGA